MHLDQRESGVDRVLTGYLVRPVTARSSTVWMPSRQSRSLFFPPPASAKRVNFLLRQPKIVVHFRSQW